MKTQAKYQLKYEKLKKTPKINLIKTLNMLKSKFFRDNTKPGKYAK
jgi:hypothetical protein